MQKSYIFFYFLTIILVCGSLSNSIYSQSDTPVSVGMEKYFSGYKFQSFEKPVQYMYGKSLETSEIHLLETLSQMDRKKIEEEIDPPAIGILRDLKDPIYFTLDEIEIPSKGEVSVSGGRMTRIDKNLLVWTTLIKSEKADEIRVFFSKGYFPEGVSVNIFSKDDYAINIGELKGLLNENGFFTTTIFADYVIIQVVIPIEKIGKGLYFEIPQVIHADNRYLIREPNSDCYQDVNCSYANSYSEITSLKQSTAKLTFLVGSLYYICSGGLLNDIRSEDFQPFLLTANHCFSTQASAVSLESRFDYFTTSCNGSTNPNVIIINGSNLVATNSQSDFTMVLLSANPGGNRTYLGWTTGSISNGETLHSVHHPAGIPQKYSRHQNKTSPAYNCSSFSTSNFHYTTTLGGQTTGGSSGGLIVQPDGHVVGQLYGVCHPTTWDNCDYTSYNNMWGRFNISYSNNNLQYWLYGGGASVSMSTNPSTSLNFGTVNVGSYVNQTVTVTNTGSVPNYLNLEAGTITISGTYANQFSIIGTTSLYLSPGQSGNFTIRFTPSSSGTKSATLNIPNNADNVSNPKTITLTGVGATSAPDPCSNIISINGCGSGYPKTYTGGGTGAWFTSSANPCTYTTPGIEQIYSFVAPYTGTYSIQVTSASGYVDYLWKSSACSSSGWTCISDITNTGQYGSMTWTAGTTYYILLDDENSTTGSHTFYINCPIICVDCPTYDFTLSPTSSWLTHSSSHVANGCKMYRITLNSGDTYTFKTGCGDGATASYDTYLELYNSSCTLLASDDDGCETNRSKIEWTATYTGYVYLKVKGFSSGNGNYTLAYKRCTTPAQPGTISGNTSVCQGSTNTYSISAVSGATSYTWTLPSGWSGSSTSTSINSTAGASGGTITVKANNSCGSGPTQSKSVTVAQLPSQPGTISGNTPVCQGSTNTYSISAVSGATSYTWTLPSGWSGSSTSTSINATAGGSGGTITVKANNSCGSGPTQSKSVTVSGTVPSQPGAITGPTTVASGNTVTYSISSVSGATSYTWAYSGDGTPVGSGTSITLTPTSSGVLSVTANNTCGSSPARTLSITVGSTVPLTRFVQNITIINGQTECYDAIQTITVAGSGTTVDIYSGGNATFIAGQHVFFEPGFHAHSGSLGHAYITLTGNYCSNPATMAPVADTITEQLSGFNKLIVEHGPDVNIYPNPTKGSFTIDFLGNEITSDILLLNFQGNQVYQTNCVNQLEKIIDIGNLPAGMYIIIIETPSHIITKKIVKTF